MLDLKRFDKGEKCFNTFLLSGSQQIDKLMMTIRISLLRKQMNSMFFKITI